MHETRSEALSGGTHCLYSCVCCASRASVYAAACAPASPMHEVALPSGVAVFMRPARRGDGRSLDFASAQRACELAGRWTGLCSLDEASAALSVPGALMSESSQSLSGWTRCVPCRVPVFTVYVTTV
jgi:hypothetical protein